MYYKVISIYLKKLDIIFAISARFCTFAPGELAEWSIAAVLKTVELWKVPGVRIPSSPQINLLPGYAGLFYLVVFSTIKKARHFAGLVHYGSTRNPEMM